MWFTHQGSLENTISSVIDQYPINALTMSWLVHIDWDWLNNVESIPVLKVRCVWRCSLFLSECSLKVSKIHTFINTLSMQLQPSGSVWIPARVCMWTHSAVGPSRSLCKGMISWPRNRLMIGRLLANLSFTSISKTSVIRATKVYFYTKSEMKRSFIFTIISILWFHFCFCFLTSNHLLWGSPDTSTALHWIKKIMLTSTTLLCVVAVIWCFYHENSLWWCRLLRY